MNSDSYRELYSRASIGPWYLKDSQLVLYKMLMQGLDVTAKCHRRFGKGTTTLTYVFDRCKSEKDLIVRYGAETQTQAYGIFNFLKDKIYYLCPELRPKFCSREQQNYYLFPNTGSKIFLFGVKDSGEIDKARGAEANIIICDEFGFWKFKAEYILKSVLQPQLLETKGQRIITSTPPEDLTHNYVSQVAEAELDGRLFNWTIKDSVMLGEKTEDEHQHIIKDSGGLESVHYKREYMCELIPTKERLVIPEAQIEEDYLGTQKRPSSFDAYVCMDLGLRDYTHVLFGYLDFKNARLVIEKEYAVNYTATSEITDNCKRIEKELDLKDRVHRRIGDCEIQQLFDMSTDHDYQVSAIHKRSKQSGHGFKDSVLNQLRLAIQSEKILIDLKNCPKLCQQLKYGIWNERRTDFQRTDSMGHLDGLMALAYLYDNVDWPRNPYPNKYDHLKESDSYISEAVIKERQQQLQQGFGKLIGR